MTVAINSLREISDHFDAYLIDQYGVVHDGVRAHFGAAHAVEAIYASKKPLVMISNSGRSGEHNREVLMALGIPSAMLNAVLTSGDSSRLIMERLSRNSSTVQRCYPITNDNNTDFLTSMGFALTDSPHETDIVFLAGIGSKGNDVDAFADELSGFLSSGAAMVCANPDVHCLVKGELKFGPGKLADIYQQMGGEVHIIGKPHAPIFELAMDMLPKNMERSRILMVGDSLANDILGAQRLGLRTLLIGCGIHRMELGLGRVRVDVSPPRVEMMNLEKIVSKLASEHQLASPDYVAPLFIW